MENFTDLNIGLTFKLNIKTAECQLNSQQIFAQSFVIMRDPFFGTPAEGKGEVFVGFLLVVIWSYCVHPQYHFFSLGILQEYEFL